MMQQRLSGRPLMFGAPGRQLFAMLHATAQLDETRPCVLLCCPFGQEAIRAHRTFKVLAERLARAGHPALRFDYYGTGDAGGDDTDVRLAGLSRDIETADATLRREAGTRPVIWLGLGLGATAAWIAAAAAARPPDRLLLWDPVLVGGDYLAALRHRHAEFLRTAFSIEPREPPQSTDFIEAIGFAVSTDFAAELAALAPERLPVLPATVDAVVITSASLSENVRQLVDARRSPRRLRHVEVAHDIDWMVENIDNGTLVPAAALQSLLALVREAA